MLCDTSAALTTWALSSSRVPVTLTEVTLKIGAQSAPASTASSTASTRTASSGWCSARSRAGLGSWGEPLRRRTVPRSSTSAGTSKRRAITG